MKITNIEIIPIFIPWKKTQPVSFLAHGKRPCNLLKVSTDEGITGYSEEAVTGFSEAVIRAFIESRLKPILLGENPMNVERLWDKMYRQGLGYKNNKGAGIAALGVIEVALWDIIGKARNLPVYEMIGGLSKNKIKAYASMMGYETPMEVAEAALHYAAEGYTAMKLHEVPANAVASIKAVREAVGDKITLMLDMNGTWTTKQAVESAKQLEQYEVLWLEEPIWPVDDYEGLAYLRERTNILIAGGETENTLGNFKEMITKQAVDLIEPDVLAAGGILNCRKVFALAEAWNLKIATHSYTFGPSLAAAVHLSLSNIKTEYFEICAAPLEAYYMQPSLRQENGYITLPDRPGLGIEIDEDVVKKYSSP